MLPGLSIPGFDDAFGPSRRRGMDLDALLQQLDGTAQRRDLTDEEADSLVQHLVHGGLGALHAVGSVFDVGGPQVRQGLGGLFGVDAENPDEGVTSKDLYRALFRNVAGTEADPGGWNEWLGTLATDIATAPMTWANPFGAFTKAGQVASKSGLLGRVGARGLTPELERVAVQKAARVAEEAASGLGRPLTAAEMKGAIGSVGARSGGTRVGTRWAGAHTTIKDLLNSASDASRPLLESQARQVAESSGLLWDDILKQPIRGAFNVGAPFTEGLTFGTDWASHPLLRAYGNTLDRVGDAARWSWPGRQFARLFDSDVKGVGGIEGQTTARDASAYERATARDALGRELPIMREFESLAGDVDRSQLSDMLYFLTERKAGKAMSPVQRELDAILGGLDPAAQGRIRALSGDIGEFYKDAVARREATGMAPRTLQDEMIEFASRRSDGIKPSGFWTGDKVIQPDFIRAREELFKGVDGGTATLNAIARDPKIAGPAALPLEEAALELMGPRYGITDPEKAMGLAKYFSKKAPGEFYMPIVSALSRYGHGAARTEAGAQALIDMVARHWKSATGGSVEGVGIGDILKNVGMTTEGSYTKQSLENLAKQMPGWTPDGVRTLLDAGAKIPEQMANDVMKVIKGFVRPEPLDDVANAIDAVNSLWRVGVTSPWPAFHVRNYYSGQIQNALNGAWDLGSMNEVSTMLKSGRPIPGMASWPGLQPVLDAKGLAHTDDEAFKVFQEMVYRNQAIGRSVNITAGPTEGLATDLATALPGERPYPGLMGTIREAFTDNLPGKANPLASRGSTKLNELLPSWAQIPEQAAERSLFVPYKIGENVGWYVEAMNRITPAVNLLKKGWSPDAAFDFVKFMQAEYSPKAFTAFENSVMRRLVPFYAYQKQMVRYIVNTLLEHPGGGLSQAIRASSKATEGNEVLPDYITQGAAIPIGGTFLENIFGPNPEGGPRVLGGLSLMHESPMALLGGAARLATGRASGAEALKETGAEMMSQVTPLLKGPMEFVTGKSFWQRGPTGLRDVEEQDPIIGRILANVTGSKDVVHYPGEDLLEPAVANVLAPRLATTVRQATDPRKRAQWASDAEVPPWLPVPGMPFWSNALLGTRIVDVGPRQQDTIVRELADQDLLRSPLAKQFENVYIPAKMLEALGPSGDDLQQLLALKRILTKRAQQRAKGEKGQRVGTGAYMQ